MKRPRIEGAAGTGGGGGGGGAVSTVNLDADDPVDDDDDDDDDDDSDEDDTAELMAELQRIKKERASEKSKKDEEVRLYERESVGGLHLHFCSCRLIVDLLHVIE